MLYVLVGIGAILFGYLFSKSIVKYRDYRRRSAIQDYTDVAYALLIMERARLDGHFAESKPGSEEKLDEYWWVLASANSKGIQPSKDAVSKWLKTVWTASTGLDEALVILHDVEQRYRVKVN